MNPSLVFVILFVLVTLVRSEEDLLDLRFEGDWKLVNCSGPGIPANIPESTLSFDVYGDHFPQVLRWYSETADGNMIGDVIVRANSATPTCQVVQIPSSQDGQNFQTFLVDTCKSYRNYKLSDDLKAFEVVYTTDKGNPQCTYKKFMSYIEVKE